MRGLAVVAAGDAADDQLDGFLIAFGQRARSEHGIGRKHCLERSGPMSADRGKGVGHTAGRLLDLRIDFGGGASGGLETGNSKTGHDDTPSFGLEQRLPNDLWTQYEILNVAKCRLYAQSSQFEVPIESAMDWLGRLFEGSCFSRTAITSASCANRRAREAKG